MTATFPLLPVREAPFRHVEADGWLDAELYAALAASFPDCPPASGPTGFTLFPGDPAYDALIACRPEWATLHDRFHSQAFVDYCLAQFATDFAAHATVDLARARYVDFIETRAQKERPRLDPAGLDPDALWVRLDVMQGRTGYVRAPHLDHRRRAISLLVYFCDADDAGLAGGDLVLHGLAGEQEIVRPRHNRMVAFACHGTSVHAVSPIRTQRRPRNFIQVTLSSTSDLWPPRPRARGIAGLARALVRNLRD